jgi:hypothetical protein
MELELWPFGIGKKNHLSNARPTLCGCRTLFKDELN